MVKLSKADKLLLKELQEEHGNGTLKRIRGFLLQGDEMPVAIRKAIKK